MRASNPLRVLLAAAALVTGYALLASLPMVAGAIPPIVGVASAASPSTTCPIGEGEGHTCILVISAPESVPTDQTFTVQVAVTTDGTTVAKSDPCGSKVLVTLDVSGGDYFKSYSTNARAGIATFDVSVPSPASPGPYELVASVGEVSEAAAANCGNYFYFPASADFNAVDVPPGQPIAPCPADVSCIQIVNDSGSAATLFANSASDPGMFTASFGSLAPGAGCGNLPADSGGVLTFNYSGLGSKTIVFALKSELITKGIGLYNVCWTGIGVPVLLPNCKQNDVGPCVLFRMSGRHNVGFFGIHAPSGDPQAYPG